MYLKYIFYVLKNIFSKKEDKKRSYSPLEIACFIQVTVRTSKSHHPLHLKIHSLPLGRL